MTALRAFRAIGLWRSTPAPAARSPLTLTGRGLLAARLAFLAFAALAIWLDATKLWRNWQAYGSSMFAGGLTPESLRAALAGTWLTPGLYLGISTAAQLLGKLTFYVAAVILFRKRSDEVIAILVALFLLAQNSADFPPTLFALLATEPVSANLHLAVTLVFAILSVWLFFLFPDGRFIPRWTIPIAVLWGLQSISDFYVVRAIDDNGPLLSSAEYALVAIAAVAAQVYRYRRISGSVERQQTKWFLGGLGIWFVVFAGANVCLGANGLLVNGVPSDRGVIPWLIVTLANTLAAFCIVGALAIAVLRFRLFAIDVIFNRALVYGGLTAAIVGLYVFIIGYLAALFRTDDNLAISLAAAAVVAVLFHPLREWLQRGANRLLYGERDEPYAVISRLGRRLEGTLAPAAILPTVVETVAGALRLPYAAIALGRGPNLAIAAATGTPAPNPLRLPLTYQGEDEGELLLAPRAPGEGFSAADRRLLADLARQAGVAARAVRLADEARRLADDLQVSRERLILAREEERRRLRRDLHDGLGPRLAALTLRVETARDRLAHDPLADQVLGDLATRLEEAVADVRRVVYALRPPALDDLGLAGALRQAAEGYGPGATRIAVEAPAALPPLPAAVEVAAYHIAQEALTNVVRHAAACACTLRLAYDPTAESLTVEVEDDGRGIAPGRPAGVGLASLRERAAELGGACTIEARSEGGTLVRSVLPCRPPGAEGEGAA
ncbi:MAG TPA: histidine kinase [Thermomicrobiales bacterium]|nr:histidine kinase [Thermomicrobiales bacterium]